MTERLPSAQRSSTKPSCSLYVIQASNGRSAVVFRRGPSKRVMIARWYLDDDRIENGHWFAGRLYERQCDLSPDGELLLYFAARYKRPPYTWTAISRPPFLTALVMWTCCADGGGFFDNDRSVVLANLVTGAPSISQNRTLTPYPEGELRQHLSFRHFDPNDDLRRHYCLEHGRMIRDGWRCVNEGVRMTEGRFGLTPVLVEPQIYERHPPPVTGSTRRTTILRRTLRSVGEYKTEESFEILDRFGMQLRNMDGCTWVDWHAAGDLLIARNGSLFRLKRSLAAEKVDDAMQGATLVHDFRDAAFKPQEPPAWATTWPT